MTSYAMQWHLGRTINKQTDSLETIAMSFLKECAVSVTMCYLKRLWLHTYLFWYFYPVWFPNFDMYSFETTVASRWYHIYKERTWKRARVGQFVKVEVETNQASRQVDPYACAIKIKNDFYDIWDTVGHMPRETHIFLFTRRRWSS